MKVCYFGIYAPDFSRNKIYIQGLRSLGVEVIECQDSSPGLRKYWELWQKHRKIRDYDALVVGYPGHLLVPFAKLISRRPVIADLLGSLEDAERNSHHSSGLRNYKNKIIDKLAILFADIVLLESVAQKDYFARTFGASSKYRVLYTGADNSIFYCSTVSSKKNFTVLFRGRLTPESGIAYILESAGKLKDDSTIHFSIIGFGKLLAQTEQTIREKNLTNVELISTFLPEEELREKMCESSLSLGQFENNPRLSRTIPHKAYESFSMGIPYLSGDSLGIGEVLTDGETGFLVPIADTFALAAKIKELSTMPELLLSVSLAAKKKYSENYSPIVLAQELLALFTSVS